MATTGSSASKQAPKKGQSTLQKAWDKKEETSKPAGIQTVTAEPATKTAPMTETTPPANNATDTKMRNPPEPHTPPTPAARGSSLAKRLKAVSADSKDSSKQDCPSAQPTGTKEEPITFLQTMAAKVEDFAPQLTPPTMSKHSPPGSPSPTMSPQLKPRGRDKEKVALPSARAPTPPRSNRSEPADTRFELRLTIPAASPDEALKAITETLSKILAKIWDSDKKAKVVPWYNNSQAPLIGCLEDLPTKLSALRQYFPRLTPNSKGGTKFSSIRLWLSLPATTLKEDIDWYLRDNKHGLYVAQIQAETVDTILWLLWSHDMIDTEVLRHSLEVHVAIATGVDIPIGLRWRIIQLDQPGRVPDDEAVKALHIDVAREHRTLAKKALEDIYSSKQTKWPIHIRMRAVPLLKDVMNSQVKKDIHRLIGRQASFNDEDLGKKKISSWEIKELDFENQDDYTLRDYIMALPHPVDKEKSMFHSVDHLRFNRSQVVFTCMPSVEAEARNMVACLITHLNHHYGDAVNEFFTKEAQLRAAGSYWDPIEECVRNEDDAHVASLAEVDKDYDLPPVKKQSTQLEQTIPARPEPTSLQRNTFGEEDDSIATFRREQVAFDSVSLSSTTISDSMSTIATLTSRLSALENLLSTHNIALPDQLSASTNTAAPPTAGESGTN